MAKKKAGRELVGLVCKECKSQNYVSTRNKINIQTKTSGSGKLNINKYCKTCKKHQPHKETTRLK